MIATVVRNVNSRFEPNTGARKAAPKTEGSKVEIVDLVNGETYRGSNLWFIDDQGLHYTSHAISIGANKNKLSGYIDFAALWSSLGTTAINIGIYDTGVTRNDKLFGDRLTQLNHSDADVTDHHADYMAAIIAGGDFSNGYFGILPKASLYSYQSVKRGNDCIVTLDDLKIALRLFIDKGVDVINISMRSNEQNDAFETDQPLQQLLDECKQKQIAVTACTGNDGEKADSTIYYPARNNQVYAIAGCNLVGISLPGLYSDTNLWTGVKLLAPADPIFTSDFFSTIGMNETVGTSVSTAIATAIFGVVRIRNRISNPGKNDITAIDEYIAGLPDFQKDPAYAFINATSFKLMNLENLKTI